MGDRALWGLGPWLWNKLTLPLRKPQTTTPFKSELKKYFFKLAFANCDTFLWRLLLVLYVSFKFHCFVLVASLCCVSCIVLCY